MGKKKSGSIIRYSDVTPIAPEHRPSAGLLLDRWAASGRVMTWLFDQELKCWHERKKRPLWHLFRVKEARELVNCEPATIQPVLAYMEHQRWIRRRYRYVKGRPGCNLYIRAVLPKELFIWEKDPNYKRKLTMRKPVNGFNTRKFIAGCVDDLRSGKAKFEDFRNFEEYERIVKEAAKFDLSPNERKENENDAEKT